MESMSDDNLELRGLEGDVLDAAEGLASEAAAVLSGSLLRTPLERALREYTEARDRLDRYGLDTESEHMEPRRG